MIELLRERGFVPRSAVWELTLACNLRCRHCGSRAGHERGDELPLDHMLRIAGELADLGCTLVTLSGGEPLLREGWPEIAKALTDRGVAVNFISNGQVFSREIGETALAVGIRNANFSIDGLEESHTMLRRVPGNFAKIMENIDLCHELGLSVGAITTIHRRNIGELAELHALLGRKGVAVWQVQLATPSGNLADNDDLWLEPESMLDLIPLLAELRQRPGPRLDIGDNIGYYGGYEGAFRGDGEPPFWVGCHAGCSVIGIESDGHVKGCLSLPSARNGVDRFVEGDLREGSLAEIWSNPEAFAYNRRFTLDDLAGFCRTCEHADICRGGCSWGSFANAGERDGSKYCYHRLLCEKMAREAT